MVILPEQKPLAKVMQTVAIALVCIKVAEKHGIMGYASVLKTFLAQTL